MLETLHTLDVFLRIMALTLALRAINAFVILKPRSPVAPTTDIVEVSM